MFRNGSIRFFRLCFLHCFVDRGEITYLIISALTDKEKRYAYFVAKASFDGSLIVFCQVTYLTCRLFPHFIGCFLFAYFTVLSKAFNAFCA